MTEVKYENGTPTFEGNTVVKCFKDNGNGLLFRLVNDEKKQWAFYNDTKEYNMVVKAAFGKDSKVEPLGSTKMEKDEETGEFKCEVQVAPLATELFVGGEPNGYKLNFEANPIVK
ncbi:calpain-like cysteine peptidase [Trypanosoma conorhini]|uniref:Calpain-like cysteine peptidase n=1 Tax=Trypanosoma conorhini TaxID=83891 RepID=A0A3R7NQX3_9TRYP|nr:calpain-like cysteine peptidase [Trypanosoma conorhini]RNF25678.1 calpain-like cysteine peptidase [Trypanosoma conorhini]